VHAGAAGDTPSRRCDAGVLAEVRHDHSQGSGAALQVLPRRQRTTQVSTTRDSLGRCETFINELTARGQALPNTLSSIETENVKEKERERERERERSGISE